MLQNCFKVKQHRFCMYSIIPLNEREAFKHNVHQFAQDYQIWGPQANEVFGKLFTTAVMTAPEDALVSRVQNLNNGFQCYVKNNMMKHFRQTLYDTLRERTLYDLVQVSDKVSKRNASARDLAENFKVGEKIQAPLFVPPHNALIRDSLENFVYDQIIEYAEGNVPYDIFGDAIFEAGRLHHMSSDEEMWKEYDRVLSALRGLQ